ncbi:Putative diheme cytochrome c-553 [hydrothermal vent metagenome]|uniref:Diheme cytochrome c-553 n=1 Tax=hydrothermal vent metagenome TaxID=652676 RepID=A0A3B0QZJ1_9ZZZZ
MSAKIKKNWLLFGFCSALAGLAIFWFLTIPKQVDASELPKYTVDVENGRYMFYAGGCASCHAKKGAVGKELLEMVGGKELKTPFGSFFVPNISPDVQHGIGGWSDADFVTAMVKGTSPDGKHYFPSFPYASYQNMKLTDILDLKAFMDTLPAISSEVKDHELPLIFSWRRGLGLWKLLFMKNSVAVYDNGMDDVTKRGAYLVQGPAHCSECHTSRNFLGGPDRSRFLAGGPAPEGKGFIPNLTPDKTGIGSWSQADIAYSLESGFTPDFDTFGSTMAEVQVNMAKLTKQDRQAIARYIKSLKAIKTVKVEKPKKPD